MQGRAELHRDGAPGHWKRCCICRRFIIASLQYASNIETMSCHNVYGRKLKQLQSPTKSLFGNSWQCFGVYPLSQDLSSHNTLQASSPQFPPPVPCEDGEGVRMLGRWGVGVWAWCTRGGQRTTSGICPFLPPWLRRAVLFCVPPG